MINNYITKGTKILLTVVLICIILAPIVPVWASDENSYIENSQLVILALGIVLSVYASKNEKIEKYKSKLLKLSVPIWLILMAREISWGRALFRDPVTGDFISREALGYWPIVYPLVAITLVVTLFGMYKAGIVREIYFWLSKYKSLLVPAIIMLTAITTMTLFEKNIIPVEHGRNQVCEELSEVIIYFTLVTICWDFYIEPYKKK